MKSESKIASFFNAIFISFRHIGIFSKAEKVIERMGPTEKLFFYIASLVVVVTGVGLLISVNNSFLVEVPAPGGKFTEGIIGSPRFINPILSISDTDKDLSSLVYSGLLKSEGNGKYIGDLASSFSISEDGTHYSVVMRPDNYFHDGTPVTADDVIFTISKILDPVIKSPKRANWEGVSVEKINDHELSFVLSKPYSPFLESLTLGILPKHIWENATSEEFPFSGFNISPVGSGPYMIDKISRNSGGIPITISLSSWKKYSPKKPMIKKITFKFYQNEEELIKAYKNQDIDSMSGINLSSAGKVDITKGTTASSPRIFALFLNQNAAPIFVNGEVRKALNMSAPKSSIVKELLSGLGNPLNGPTPLDIETEGESGNISGGRELLEASGWKVNENGILERKTKDGTSVLKFSIATSDVTELKRAAEMLKESWTELGAEVDIKVFESADLNQNIIRSRKYDALLFGEVVSDTSDLYPFWHSSQRNDPGLNIALYANITVDKLLDEIRSNNTEEVQIKRKEVTDEIKKDLPAIFLFSPDIAYFEPKQVKNIALKDVSFAHERFNNVSEWYIETDKVWQFIADKYK